MRTACSGLSSVLGIAKDAASNSGIPGLATALGGLQYLLKAIQKTSQNAEDVKELSKRIERLISVLRSASNLSPAALDRMEKLARTLNDASEGAEKLLSHNFMKRALTFTRDSERLKGQVKAVTWSVESFTVEMILHMEFALEEHVHFVQDQAQFVVRKLDQIQSVVNEMHMDLKTGDGHPPHAVKAVFNSTDRECCADSTRTAILKEIYAWIGADGPASLDRGKSNTDPSHQQACIFWLNGSAGTGKTTIAYTVAQYCSNRKPGILGASFFCSRDDANCSNLRFIFTTIAYQLSLFNPQFATEVSKVLKAAPDIGYSSVQYQLEELIVNPLRMVRDSFSHCVIVLDALDECKDTATISTVLSALARHIGDLSPLQFLVTSRPENRIRAAFTLQDLEHKTKRLLLHQVQLELVEQDISHYLSMKLVETRRTYGIKEPWPAPGSIDSLAKLSSGLFIFAATSIKYIEDAAYSDPRGQLQRLTSRAVTATGVSSPFNRLDELYSEVLTLALPDISSSFLGLLKMVLGSIVHLQDPLSVIGLANLLGLRTGRVRETLLHLHSILIVPENDHHVIRLLHPSFADFITNPERCSIPKPEEEQ
ncbi:hypothetical protein B0H13DRAFT_2365401 [Mycena leptocephala]|nr:hypothetical protein B0H13DRAFT_2365401 [Mycena leptocephala]